MAFIDSTESRDRKLALLLQTANQIQTQRIAQEELNLKKQELDPKVQAGRLASTMAMLGNTEAAERLIKFSQEGVILPSQSPQPATSGITDYLGDGQPRLNSVSVGLSPTGIGVVGGTLSAKGGFSARFGNQGLSEIDKANLDIAKSVATERVKREGEQKAGLDRTLAVEDVYLNQYARSYEELKKYDPNIGAKGSAGFASRQYAKVLKTLDEFPETKALEKMAKPIAQEIATALEGRATDEDRKTQMDLLVNALAGPTEENIRVAANNILMMEAKGANISGYVERLSNSRIPILKEISNAVYKESKTAKNSNVDVDKIFEEL